MNNIFFLLEKGILDDLFEGLGMFVEGVLRSIFYSICALIYKMIYYFYNVFEVLCNGQLLESSELNELFGRISLLLGVIMLFRVAFSFIQALIDPDTGFGDKEKGIPNVIKKVVIVIIMFGLSGYIFDLTAQFQALIIKNNVISKFLLPHQINSDSFGGALAADLFTTFYHINPNIDASTFSSSTEVERKMNQGTAQYTVQYSDIGACAHENIYMNGLRYSIKENNDFNYMKIPCLGAKGVYADENGNPTDDDEWVIEFNYIFCLLVGVVVLWFLINYCLSVGIRVIQLTILQLLAPIAFVGYLEPKSDNMFSKWLKVYISTYIDVFIRMGIISFVCYICALLMKGWNTGDGVFWTSVGNPTGKTAKIIGILMILALFQFARKAPELLKSIFPTGASGLSFGTNKEAFKPLGTGLAVGAGVAGGLAYGAMAARGRYKDSKKYKLNDAGDPDLKKARLAALGGFGSGMLRGMTGVGFKKGNIISNLRSGFKDQVAKDDEYRDLIATGGSRTGQVEAYVSNLFGSDRGSKDEIIIKNAKTVEDVLKTFSEKAEGTQTYQNLMLEIQGAYNNGQTAKAEALRKLANDWKERYIQRSVNGDLNAGDNITASGGTYIDENGQSVTLTRNIETSGGDVQKGNGMRSAYIELASQMNAIQTEARGKGGIDDVTVVLPNGHQISDFSMVSENSVTYQQIDDLLKAARITQDNVRGTKGYRAGQANKPKNSNRSS